MLKEKEAQKPLLHIKHHSICLESKEPKEGYEQIEVLNPRTNEMGTKYVKRYRSVDGYVDKAEWYKRTDDKYGVTYAGYKIHLSDNGSQYVLDIPFGTNAYTYFVKAAGNVNWTQKVEFAAWATKEGKTGFAMMQGGQSIKQQYTAANPGDCPAPLKKSTPTGDKWDFTDQEIWLDEQMKKVVIPAIDKAAQSRGAFHAQAPAPVAPAKADPHGEPDWPEPSYDDDIVPF